MRRITEKQLNKVISSVLNEYIGDNGELGKEYLDSEESYIRHQRNRVKVNRSILGNRNNWSCTGDKLIDPTVYS